MRHFLATAWSSCEGWPWGWHQVAVDRRDEWSGPLSRSLPVLAETGEEEKRCRSEQEKGKHYVGDVEYLLSSPV